MVFWQQRPCSTRQKSGTCTQYPFLMLDPRRSFKCMSPERVPHTTWPFRQLGCTVKFLPNAWMPRRDTVCTIFIVVFGMTRPGHKPATYHIRGRHANPTANPTWSWLGQTLYRQFNKLSSHTCTQSLNCTYVPVNAYRVCINTYIRRIFLQWPVSLGFSDLQETWPWRCCLAAPCAGMSWCACHSWEKLLECGPHTVAHCCADQKGWLASCHLSAKAVTCIFRRKIFIV